MAAYRTASRLTSSHLPNLYIGIEYVRTNNAPLAHRFLRAAQELCDTDPLLYNELGVVLFRLVRATAQHTYMIAKTLLLSLTGFRVRLPASNGMLAVAGCAGEVRRGGGGMSEGAGPVQGLQRACTYIISAPCFP